MSSPVPIRKRKYQEIWERVKTKGSCTVSIPVPALRDRVKKAVIKEKHRDLGFKLLNDHDNFFLEITYDPKLMRMKFTLKQTLGLEGIKGATR